MAPELPCRLNRGGAPKALEGVGMSAGEKVKPLRGIGRRSSLVPFDPRTPGDEPSIWRMSAWHGYLQGWNDEWRSRSMTSEELRRIILRQTVCSLPAEVARPRSGTSEGCSGWAGAAPPAQGTSHAAEKQSVCRSGYLQAEDRGRLGRGGPPGRGPLPRRDRQHARGGAAPRQQAGQPAQRSAVL